MDTTEWDVVVVGGGPAGEVVADECRRHGLSVALVEAALLGGTCSYTACMPSKALLRPSEVLWEMRHLPGLKDRAPALPEAGSVFHFRDQAASNFDDSEQAEWLEKAGAQLVRGKGRLVGEREVEVTLTKGAPQRLKARRAVVLATGSRPHLPPIPGLAEVDVWTNREGTTSREVPEALAVIGGGPVACELAQAWAGLGSQVTMVVRGAALMQGLPDFVGTQLLETFKNGGISVRLETEVTRAERDEGRTRLSLTEGRPLNVDAVLVATGRRPATEALGLSSVGLDEGKAVEVDDALRATGVPDGWLYAVGDVNGRAPVTHMGKYQARVAAAVIAGKEASLAKDVPTPQVLFTHPPVGTVGLTPEQAKTAGRRIRVAEVPYSAAAGTSVLGDGFKGTAQLVIDTEDDRIVGATFIGPSSGELLHAATIAIVGRVPLAALWHAVPSFPTVSELWLRLLEADRDRERT